MITCAVCDDEPLMLEEITRRLSAYMGTRHLSFHVSGFADGASLLESGLGFDLIFLDIRMRKMDGMETARRLRRLGDHGLLVFVTVLRELVFDAFTVQAFDYLLKPLEDDRFHQTMDRALRFLEQKGCSIPVRQGASCRMVSLSSVVYGEVQGRKIYLHLRDGSVIGFYEKLENLARQVDGRFFRCHRSYLVNLDCVRGCGAGQAVLPGGEKIPVSRLRERDFTQALLRRMKERPF